jgi:site-specific DNA-methyltransferase (adenine-specific)
MSLRQQILNLIQNNKQMSMSQIYTQFPDITKTTIRGRVYDNLGKGITRIGKGIYISSEAIVEQDNSLKVIDRLIEEGDQFDFIFLDIPYQAAGQKGGNRNLFACDSISPNDFGIFVNKLQYLLKTDTSPLLFMFTSGKTSKSAHDKYFNHFTKSGLVQCNRIGNYTKLWSNGNRMNMGKYLMPEEFIYVFSKSGQVDNLDQWILDFEMVPDIREYPTSKPYPMIKCLVEQATNIGDWVLDPFGGSGKILKACQELKRMCHIFDTSDKAIFNHIVPLLK